jgi:alpha-glucosidase
VAPIVDASSRRRVYLPRGVWTDWWTGERFTGSRWTEAEAGLDVMPLYLREGAIVPMGPVMNYVDETPVKELTIRVAAFEGDGRSSFVAPVNDEQVLIEYEAKKGKHTVSVDPCGVTVRLEVVGKGNIALSKRRRKK